MTNADKAKLQDILNGEFLLYDWFRKQYAICILIISLAFAYIFFGFLAQRQQHQLDQLKKELKDKDAERLTIEAELTGRTRQSTLKKELEKQGSELQINTQPVMYIR